MPRQKKTQDIPTVLLETVGSNELVVPQFYAKQLSPTKTKAVRYRLVNPLTQERNLATRGGNPVVKISRRPTTNTVILGDNPTPIPLSAFSKRDKELIEQQFKLVEVNKGVTVSELPKIPKEPVKSRGRPTKMQKNIDFLKENKPVEPEKPKETKKKKESENIKIAIEEMQPEPKKEEIVAKAEAEVSSDTFLPAPMPEITKKEEKSLKSFLSKLEEMGKESVGKYYTASWLFTNLLFTGLLLKYGNRCFWEQDLAGEGFKSDGFPLSNIKVIYNDVALNNNVAFTPIKNKSYQKIFGEHLRKCISREEDIILIPLSLVAYNKTEVGKNMQYTPAATSHANMLVIRPKMGIVERFEPQGGTTSIGSIVYSAENNVNTVLKEFFEKDMQPYIGKLKYVPPIDICPSIGFQSIESKTKLVAKDIYKSNIGGFCAMWSLFFAELVLMNPDKPSKELVEEALDIAKSEPDYLFKVISGYTRMGELLAKELFDNAGVKNWSFELEKPDIKEEEYKGLFKTKSATVKKNLANYISEAYFNINNETGDPIEEPEEEEEEEPIVIQATRKPKESPFTPKSEQSTTESKDRSDKINKLQEDINRYGEDVKNFPSNLLGEDRSYISYVKPVMKIIVANSYKYEKGKGDLPIDNGVNIFKSIYDKTNEDGDEFELDKYFKTVVDPPKPGFRSNIGVSYPIQKAADYMSKVVKGIFQSSDINKKVKDATAIYEALNKYAKLNTDAKLLKRQIDVAKNKYLDIAEIGKKLIARGEDIERRKKEFPTVSFSIGAGILEDLKSFYNKGVKAVKKGVSEVKDFATTVFEGRKDYQPKGRAILRKYGGEMIKSIEIGRDPIASAIRSILDFASRGELGRRAAKMEYDEIFHLFAVITLASGKKIMTEKNEVIIISESIPARSEKAEYRVISNVPSITLQTLFDNNKQRMGDKYFTYSAKDNNCGDYLLSMLKASGIGSEEDYKFVKQDSKTLLKGMPALRKFSNTLTDFAGRLDVLISGRGAGGKETEDEEQEFEGEGLGVSYEVQSVIFDKTKFNTRSAKKWLNENKYKSPKVDTTDNFIRFRQIEPTILDQKGFTEYQNKPLGDSGIQLVIAYKKKISGKGIKEMPVHTCEMCGGRISTKDVEKFFRSAGKKIIGKKATREVEKFGEDARKYITKKKGGLASDVIDYGVPAATAAVLGGLTGAATGGVGGVLGSAAGSKLGKEVIAPALHKATGAGVSGGRSEWIALVKKVAKDKGISYKEALSVASAMRKK